MKRGVSLLACLADEVACGASIEDELSEGATDANGESDTAAVDGGMMEMEMIWMRGR